MSELEQARDHAREMSGRTMDPRDEPGATRSGWCDPLVATGEPLACEYCRFRWCPCACHPRVVPTDSERALWKRIADEMDAYLMPAEPGDEVLPL